MIIFKQLLPVKKQVLDRGWGRGEVTRKEYDATSSSWCSAFSSFVHWCSSGTTATERWARDYFPSPFVQFHPLFLQLTTSQRHLSCPSNFCAYHFYFPTCCHYITYEVILYLRSFSICCVLWPMFAFPFAHCLPSPLPLFSSLPSLQSISGLSLHNIPESVSPKDPASQVWTLEHSCRQRDVSEFGFLLEEF